jgi:hypothetical protein
MKKIILIIIIVITTGIIYQFLRYSQSHSYTLVETHELKLDRVLKHEYLDSITITTAVGSYFDTLVQIKKDNYCLLIWNIPGYHKSLKNQILLDFNNKNGEFLFTPYISRDISPVLTLYYKLPEFFSEKISINLSGNNEVYDSIQSVHQKGYCLNTAKFGIGNYTKRSDIVFDFDEKREVVVILYNSAEASFILVFYSLTDSNINESILEKIII